MIEFRHLNDRNRFRFKESSKVYYVVLIHGGYIYYCEIGSQNRQKKPYAHPDRVILMESLVYYYKDGAGTHFTVKVNDHEFLDDLFTQLNRSKITFLSRDEYISGGATEDLELLDLEQLNPIGFLTQPKSALGL